MPATTLDEWHRFACRTFAQVAIDKAKLSRATAFLA
jgi:hypothetical protein